jgi:hypothetical protein
LASCHCCCKVAETSCWFVRVTALTCSRESSDSLPKAMPMLELRKACELVSLTMLTKHDGFWRGRVAVSLMPVCTLFNWLVVVASLPKVLARRATPKCTRFGLDDSIQQAKVAVAEWRWGIAKTIQCHALPQIGFASA